MSSNSQTINQLYTDKLTFSYSHSNILSSTDNQTGDLTTLYKLISDPKLKAKFVQVQNMTRTLYEGHLSKTDAEKLKLQIDFLKKDLGFYFPSGTNDKGHLGQNLSFNGCIGFDYDFHFRGGDLIAQGLKEALKGFDFVSFVHLSSGGYGVKGIIQTNLKECDKDLYRFAQTQIFSFLSTEGVSFQYDPHGYGKTCYFAYDKQPYLNLNAKSFHIDLVEYRKTALKQAQNNRKTTVKHNDDEVKQAVEFLIENKINVATCYDEYLSFTRACINTFDTEGGDIAFSILENSEQFNVSTFKTNFDAKIKDLSKPSNSGEATARSILYHARENGFRYQAKAIEQPFNQSFDNLDLFVVNRTKTLERIKQDTGNKIVVCEESYIEDAKNELKTHLNTIICTYKELSKLSIDTLHNSTIYVFGCQNLVRKMWENVTNEIEKVSKHTKTVLFADAPTHLNIAKSITIIDRYTPNSKIIVADNPQATFVELIKKESPNNVLFCDTSESINKQLADYQKVKRSELYAANHSKTMYVLYDKNVGLLPEAFTQFENIVFVVNSEKKAYINMSTFCAKMDKDVRVTLQFTDSFFCNGATEKGLFEDVKRKIIPIRHNSGKWERCPNTEGILENEHQISILVSDAAAMQAHIERISVSSKDLAYTSEETETISETIKEAKKELAEEKKIEFFEFLDKVKSLGISSLSNLKEFVEKQTELSRGAKVAYNRLKILLKLNNEFTTCFEAVKDSYSKWTQTRGRFRASKIVKTNTKTGKALQLFRDTTEGGEYAKHQLIEIARIILPMTGGTDNEVWKQLKTYSFLTQKRIRIEDKRVYVYSTQFLE